MWLYHPLWLFPDDYPVVQEEIIVAESAQPQGDRGLPPPDPQPTGASTTTYHASLMSQMTFVVISYQCGYILPFILVNTSNKSMSIVT